MPSPLKTSERHFLDWIPSWEKKRTLRRVSGTAIDSRGYFIVQRGILPVEKIKLSCNELFICTEKMLTVRASFAQGIRIASSSPYIASTSSCPCAGALLHTSFVQRAQLAHRTGSHGSKKANTLIQQESKRKAIQGRPSIVLGNRPGDEKKWQNCDLAKILVTEEELHSPSESMETSDQPIGTLQLPKHMNFGVGEVEKPLLFRHLPVLSAQASVLANQSQRPEVLASLHAEGQEKELFKASSFAKVVDLRNANAGGIAYENRRRIIRTFSTPENPFDPGRAEVQAALLTYRIRNLYSHLTAFRRDVGNRRGLRKLVHQRAKILRYLKGIDRQRYDVILERLGLEPESVEGELVV